MKVSRGNVLSDCVSVESKHSGKSSRILGESALFLGRSETKGTVKIRISCNYASSRAGAKNRNREKRGRGM